MGNPERGGYFTGHEKYNACLYGFDVDSASLKAAHKEWLDLNLVPQLTPWLSSSPNRSWYFQIEGRASRTGTELHNLRLATRRALSVYEHLRGRSNLYLIPYGVGEALSKQGEDTDYLDRCVFLIGIQTEKEEPKKDRFRIELNILKSHVKWLRAHEREQAKTTKSFRLRMMHGVSAGAALGPVLGVQFDKLHFRIEDLDTGDIGVFDFTGFGMSAGLSLAPPVSVALTDQTTETCVFETKKSVTLSDFAGPVSFDIRAVGMLGQTTTTNVMFEKIGKLVRDVPTGSTFLTGGSVSAHGVRGWASLVNRSALRRMFPKASGA